MCVCVCDVSELLTLTFFLSSSFSMGSTAEHAFASTVSSNLAYLLNPHELHR